MVRQQKPLGPPVPAERADTVRHEIVSALTGQRLSAREISGLVRIAEKEVCGHLEHIRKTLSQSGRHLIVDPAVCQQCGFVFRKRDRLTRPSKCPICHSQHIDVPLFEVVDASAHDQKRD